jgi:hypothetical protein
MGPSINDGVFLVDRFINPITPVKMTKGRGSKIADFKTT